MGTIPSIISAEEHNQPMKETFRIEQLKSTMFLFVLAVSMTSVMTFGEDAQRVGDAIVYDHNPATQLGDAAFGTLVADMEHDHPGRCSHGGPVCLQYANGVIAAFYASTSDHNIDGWTEYALSRDGGKTWDKYNRLPYSFDAYKTDPEQPAWVEEGLVTSTGAAVLFVTHFKNGSRERNVLLRSEDHGQTWSEPHPLDGDFVGYPCAVAVEGDTNFVLVDSNSGPHALYVSTDDGQTWTKRSTLPLDDEKWYGTMCLGQSGRLVAGAYKTGDEGHFHYCISEDNGQTWGPQQAAVVDKQIRDAELAYLDGTYHLHGRSGSGGEGRHRFVLYQSQDGEQWSEGIVVSSDEHGPDGYSHNCIIRGADGTGPEELMVLYSIIYEGKDTNEYVFFIRPDSSEKTNSDVDGM